ncbi:hypothetical protein B0E50_17065 [Rhodanobacter sp. C01]|nr:hypothetical protein B0E50_17065 [Rhodanobacter sp. C01]
MPRDTATQIRASHSNEYVCIRWLLHCDASYHATQGLPHYPYRTHRHAMHVGFEHHHGNRRPSGHT